VEGAWAPDGERYNVLFSQVDKTSYDVCRNRDHFNPSGVIKVVTIVVPVQQVEQRHRTATKAIAQDDHGAEEQDGQAEDPLSLLKILSGSIEI
jgi:hypothetical protein